MDSLRRESESSLDGRLISYITAPTHKSVMFTDNSLPIPVMGKCGKFHFSGI